MQEVLDNLAKETRAIAGGSAKGVTKAGVLVMRESVKLTPRRLGNLWNSRFLVSNIPGLAPSIGGGAFKGKEAGNMSSRHAQMVGGTAVEAMAMSKGGAAPTVGIGYSAVYALAVHENPSSGAAGNTEVANKARSGTKVPLSAIHSKKGQWKFLEEPLKRLSSRVLEIIRQEAKVD
jgi:hypothetical protein